MSFSKPKPAKAVALILALAFVFMFAMPAMAAGNIQTVIVQVDANTLVEVELTQYATACATQNALYNYLKGANPAPVIVAIKGDDKYVDLTSYATKYAENNGDVGKALEQSSVLPDETMQKVFELVSFNEETGEPELKPVVDNDAAIAAAVDAKIAALPAAAELTLDNKAAVEEARAAYAALTDAQKALVTKLATLEAAEAKIAELQAAADDAAAAEAVDAKIAALPAAAELTLDNKAAVEEARAAYAALTDAQKALVTKLATLEAAEAKIAELQAAADAEAAAETAVAAYEAAPITTLDEVTAAEALEVTANEKVALVADADKKAAFEARIAAQKALVDAAKVALTALKVESVSAINAKEVEVTFNQAMDPVTAQDASKYVFSGFAAGSLNAAAAYATFADESNTKIRLVTAGVALADKMAKTDTNAKLTISGVKSASGQTYTSPATKEAVVVTAATDGTNPTVVSITPVDTHNFMVVFSEAVVADAVAANDTAGTDQKNTALNPQAYMIGTTALTKATAATNATITNPSKDCRTFLVSFADTATSIVPLFGEKEIKINNVLATDNMKITDYAGNVVPITTQKVTFSEDLTKPTVQNAQIIDRTKIRITTSELIKTASFTAANAKWGTTTYANATKFANGITYISGNTYEIDFTTANALPASGAFKFFIPKAEIVDLAGNAMLEDYAVDLTGQASPEMVITADSTTSTTQLVLKFSRNIANDATITNAANYKIDGAALKTAATVTRNSATQVTIGSITLTHGNHTATMSGLKDEFGDVIPDQTINFNVKDTASPTVSAKLFWNDATTANGTNRDLVLVAFNKVMNQTSLTTAASYKYGRTGAAAALPAGTVITALAGNKAVLLDMPDTGTAVTGDDLHVGYLKEGVFYGVTDTAGNTVDPANWKNTLLTAVTAGLDISTVGAAGGLAASNPVIATTNTITMKVHASNTNFFGAVNKADFTVTMNAKTLAVEDAQLVDADEDGFYETLKLVFAANTFDSASVANIAVAPTTTVDRFGVKLQAKSVAVTTNNIAAQLKGAAVQDATKVIVTFDKTLSTTPGAALAQSLQVYQNGAQKTISSVSNADNKKLYTITLSSAIDPLQDVTVKTVGQAAITALDSAGKPITENTTGVTSKGLSAILGATGSLSGTALQDTSTLTITFNRAVDTTSIKAGWDGTAGQTVAVSADAVADTITIAGVGTVKVADVGTGGTMTAATMGYTAGVNQLVVTFTTINPVVAADAATVELFSPAETIKDVSGGAINKDFKYTAQ